MEELKIIAKYGSALSVLGWDEEVNLPPTAHAYRGQVNALLATDLHRRLTSEKTYRLLLELSEPSVYEKLSDNQKVIVRETKRDVELSMKLPTQFVEKMSLLTTKAFGVWVEARQKKEFAHFRPVLDEIIRLKKQEAELLGYGKTPYDALLDEFEPGMTVAVLDKILLDLAGRISALIKDAPPAVDLPPANYPQTEQARLNQRVVADLGYDLTRGRIDVSPHPFTTTFHTTDVRITTRYDETDFWVSLGSTIHEAGHAMYDQGLTADLYGTPLAEPVSLGIHESQSRGWENFVGRSRSFVHYLYPRLKESFPGITYEEEELYRWLNRVQPSLIRVESDEVTYNLHIVIRYQIEKAIMSGELTAKDLPAAWNESVEKYLGLKVPDDSLGVLQDVHWSHGSIGYFPTYTLGNLYAAQFFAAFAKAHPDYESRFKKGDFAVYLKWLRQNIHGQGRRYQPLELIKKVTGEPLKPDYLVAHLAAKIRI